MHRMPHSTNLMIEDRSYYGSPLSNSSNSLIRLPVDSWAAFATAAFRFGVGILGWAKFSLSDSWGTRLETAATKVVSFTGRLWTGLSTKSLLGLPRVRRWASFRPFSKEFRRGEVGALAVAGNSGTRFREQELCIICNAKVARVNLMIVVTVQFSRLFQCRGKLGWVVSLSFIAYMEQTKVSVIADMEQTRWFQIKLVAKNIELSPNKI